MALASLCSNCRRLEGSRLQYTALIVDHRLRPGSGLEAMKVSKVLQEMKIYSRILKLDWPSVTDKPPHTLPNLESLARRLRYQALGKACRDFDIRSLLVAHHGDDQAETVLSRMVSGYNGSGLRGVRPESNIPECHGIYGVSESGSPQIQPDTLNLHNRRPPRQIPPMQIESGGVTIYRPLLDFSKAQLIATCETNNVPWFEDPTNADKELTLRNTIRHLWEEKRLPNTLSVSAMSQLARGVEETTSSRETVAESIYNDCDIDMDFRSGSVSLAFPPDVSKRLYDSIPTTSDAHNEATHRAASLVRKILLLVTPKPVIALQSLEHVTKKIFPFLVTEEDDITTGSKKHGSSVADVHIVQQKPKDASSGDASPNIELLRLLSEIELSTPPQPQTGVLQYTSKLDATGATYRIDREQAQNTASSTITLTHGPQPRASSTDKTWTPFLLFDGRYWIRIRYRPFNLSPNHSVIVRFLKRSDIETLRKFGSRMDVLFVEDELKVCAPGKVRFTLPAIVERWSVVGEDGEMEVREELCALPSIGWGRPGWKSLRRVEAAKDKMNKRSNFDDESEEGGASWVWECRYKAIDFRQGKGHTIKRTEQKKRDFVSLVTGKGKVLR